MTRRNACIICSYVLINFVLLVVAYFGMSNFNLVIWMSIIQLAATVFVMIKQKGDFLVVGVVFVALTYLFHFGQSLITTLGFNDVYAHRSVLAKTSYASYVNAELFAMGSIFFLTIGFLFSGRRVKEQKNAPLQNALRYNEQVLRIRRKATYILCATILPQLYLDIIKIQALIIDGYLGTYSTYTTGVAKYLALIGLFARPAVTVLLYAYSGECKKARSILLVSTAYYLVMMLSGDRGTNLIYIISNFFVYFKFVKSIKIKHILTGIVLGYFAMGFISSISLFRYTEFSIESFLHAFSMRSGDGVVYSILREFGGTVISLVYAIDFIPKQAPHNLGLTYVASLLTISPKLPISWVTALNTCFAYIKAFPISYQDSLGGSYLGELYYNFGWYGMVFAAFIGAFIGKIDKALSEKNSPLAIAVILVLMPNLFLWVRDFYVSMIFKAVWFAVFLLVL